MSKPEKHRNNSFLVPLGVTSAATVTALVATFVFLDRMPAPEGDAESPAAESRPTGAGTMPEGVADDVTEGIGDAGAPAVEQAEAAPEDGSAAQDEMAAGTQAAPSGDDTAATGANEEVSEAQTLSPAAETETGTPQGADIVEAAPADGSAEQEPDSDFVVDTNSGAPEGEGGEAEPSQLTAAPEGRDTVTNLDPEPGEDVVVDTDNGGTPFIPTKSGPDGGDGNALSAE
ncbi:hypothetical protein [Profundibacterium mesophilum]|uniref:Uncharacterized protein n=1 Tax=Profundibacterium mesophilum KAUST100406-0324 TaxID=1037889 RepID=A0A921TC70_9RHOB|nr:hypothetical protein [Profundibacterium mesophilum]KAF0674517.1 hypothetical protein PMES_03167 [Profundibacterium mesophilum KAUST100406-0324]